jgi:hypothetical protein
MYYAITINADQIITGVHESVTPITETTFAENPELAEDTVLPIDEPNEYQAGQPMAAYTDGVLRPLIDRINEGFAPIPEGSELIDGELVETNIPETEAPATLLSKLDMAEQRAVFAELKVAEYEAVLDELLIELMSKGVI